MIKVYIAADMPYNGLNIYIGKEVGDKFLLAENIPLNFKERKPGEAYDATFKLPFEIAGPFLEAMAEALSNHGIKTDNDHKIQGKLEAVKEHLADMRDLVFKRKPKK